MITLGIDASTQGVKAVAWDVAAKKVIFMAAVNYGNELPQYGSPNGFLPNDDGLVRHADPRMWIDGVELVLAKLQATGCPMGDVVAIGGDAQQHATVCLESLNPLVFARKTSSIWMDSSTSTECAALDAKFGERLQRDTGSPAIERFAGSQIMKFVRTEPAAYAKTTDYLMRFPKTNPLEIRHAKALNALGEYRQCIEFLKGVSILPSEFGDNAVDVWQEAWRKLGDDRMAETYPEHLGAGKPFPK